MKNRLQNLILVIFIVFLPSCNGENENETAIGNRPPDDAMYLDSSSTVEERIEDLLSRMTIEEKAGQTAQVARDFLSAKQDISEYGLGSILSGGGSVPEPNTPDAWADMIERYQSQALDSRLGIPILYGTDSVHGHNNLKGAVIFPHNIGLGAAGDPDLVERIYRATAIETRATGVHWTFAPCAAVPRDERWGRTYEGFSEDPVLTSVLTSAAVRGLQGAGPGDEDFILATAKHFIADGGTFAGKDQGDFQGSDEELRTVHLPPYRAAIEAGAGSVMASFSSWNGEKVHGRADLLTGILRDELGFDGLLVSDWAAIRQLPGNSKTQIVTAFEAGIDMVMLPDRYQEYIAQLTENVEKGRLDEALLDRAVRNILSVKFRMGLFDSPRADRRQMESIGSDEHRDLAREAVRRSAVLLKNDGDILPLGRDLLIGVSGSLADDLGSQCGGWTITWQGNSGDITEGTTILQALKDTLGESHVLYSPTGDFDEEPNVIIAVVGEKPYAEFRGDRAELSLSAEDQGLIGALTELDTPLVMLLVSGRPMIITEQIKQSDSVMVLWLPGTEGSGVADLLTGAPPEGRLPHSWPSSMAQVPINTGDGQIPLYPMGFGLSW